MELALGDVSAQFVLTARSRRRGLRIGAADRKQARVVLRFVRGLLAAPPFSPDAGVDECAALLKSYRVTKVSATNMHAT